MKNESRVMGAFIAILAIVVLIAYLFFGLEEDMSESGKPVPELLKESKKLLGSQ